MEKAEWQIGELRLRADLVWALAMSSLKVRMGRAFITGLTIATTTAFMMYLLTMPYADPNAPFHDGVAGMMGLRTDRDAGEVQGFLLMFVMALLVAAAGVLNTMLMNVSQRYREIGTIKCLGGLDRLILFSVLVEAALLGLVGAGLGVIIGLAISLLLSVADYGGAFWSHVGFGGLPLKVIFVLLIGMGLTTLGAAIPAQIAAKMPPIEAMRGEK
ncbi:MAG: ABC transporter permease [Phycisphaeraceae bacterium]|nr:ABC transporter permease [Phycisphaeraceae bacterium]